MNDHALLVSLCGRHPVVMTLAIALLLLGWGRVIDVVFAGIRLLLTRK